MGWYPISTAPADGTPIRVRVKRESGGKYEPPFMLYADSGRWYYFTTGAPIHPWHEPVEWTFDPHTQEERRQISAAYARAYGSVKLPSGAITKAARTSQERPVHLVRINESRSA